MLKIIYEDDNFLVLEKPSGMLMHPNPGVSDQLSGVSFNSSVAGEIVKMRPEIAGVGESHRPGIVHRLDKNVSGLVVVAKTKKAYEHLVSEFAEHRVQKEYIALVYGDVKTEHGVIEKKLGRGKSGLIYADAEDGRDAITEYQVLKKMNTMTRVKLMPKTGRLHQLRVHMKSIGHPIVGDPLYGLRKAKDGARIMLHASKLGFHGLNNELLEFESKPPF